MGFVIGGREVHVVMPSYLAHKPMPDRQLVSQPIPLAGLAQALNGRPVVDLPMHRGAGPSGTDTVGRYSTSAWTWTILAIIQIQGLWGHPDTPPFAASAWAPKFGPRGREAA